MNSGNIFGLVLIAALFAWIFLANPKSKVATVPSRNSSSEYRASEGRAKLAEPKGPKKTVQVEDTSDKLSRADRRELDSLLEKVGK